MKYESMQMYLSVSRYLTNVETSYFFTYPFRSVIKTRGSNSRTRNRANAMWVAKMVARCACLLRQLSGFESRHLSKMHNGRHQQSCGQHTVARQKVCKKSVIVSSCLETCSEMLTCMDKEPDFPWRRVRLLPPPPSRKGGRGKGRVVAEN